MDDKIIKPDYYKGKSGKDVIDVAEDFNLSPLQFNAIKYIVRAGRKDKEKFCEDVNKAIECLERMKSQYITDESRRKWSARK